MHLRSFRILPALLLSCLVADSAWTDTLYQSMQKNYQSYQDARLQDATLLPFDLTSSEKRVGGVSEASVRFLISDVDYDLFVSRLSIAAEWCEFIPLHLNIKACAPVIRGDNEYLQFYAGIKGYLNPKQASLLELKFKTEMKEDVFVVDLYAASGPYRSTDINFDLRAIQVEQGIYLEFDLSSIPGVAAQLAKIYLATVARKKIGFSVVGKTWTGKDKYVGGQRGATERNIVRYLLAIETYFSTLDVPLDEQYDRRLEKWFDATEQFAAQLNEMSKAEYLDIKRRERRNQTLLHEALAMNVNPVYEPEVEKQQ